MSIAQVRSVDFGSAYGGLLTVGYAVLDSTGAIVSVRTTTGVYELVSGSGMYAANITFTDDFRGSIVWDTGTVSNVRYATEQYNYEENNPKVDNVYDIERGRWKIESNQMIFYKEDNATEVARFNLFDESGNPTMDSPFERRRV